MPELPDLEVFSHNLQKTLKGKKLSSLHVKSNAKLKVTASTLKKAFEGEQLKKVYREGKELRFQFSNDHLLGMHLMLNGKLIYREDDAEQKHTILSLQFDDGSTLSLTDYQGIASASVDPEPGDAPDALSDEFTEAYLQQKLGSSRAAVKNQLLDQHVVRGIGNAYADEILWAAGIAPFSTSKAIPPAKVRALFKAIKKVLEDAITQIQKHHPDIIAGEVRDFLKIHQHKKAESPTGHAIQHQVKGGRKTYFTNEQELFE
ncbi:DNA-formamidopyrimidine glycosylase family protein [uncultured Chitinophaga sp.]|uniref:Fpg/Nei family DNA glycosylase n=1 Tax=uncultured Chitinophaga sp. TaxID=339340 RepID=UPI0025DC8BB0|nr:DNA-formamidopyrimidine glycosylase family protein [uncultured Chitinophaga sp.]